MVLGSGDDRDDIDLAGHARQNRKMELTHRDSRANDA